MNERRKGTVSKSSPLPKDYLQMVEEVFTSHFDAGLKALSKIKPAPYFEVRGEIFSDEIIMSISLTHPNELAATTVYASCDFQPKGDTSNIQELLSACVDAAGAVLENLLADTQSETIQHLANGSFVSLENVPFEWTPIEMSQRQVYVKLDKSNPKLEELTEEWLSKNDPQHLKNQEEEQKETEKLFMTGPKKAEPLH